MLDTARTFETPESVDLQLRVAGPAVRACAWAIDFLIRLVVLFVIFFVVTITLRELGVGLFLVLFFLAEWFYPIFFEVFYNGATPGKRSMGIRVVADNGTPVNWNSSVIRNLIRYVDFLPTFNGFGLVCMLLNRDFKRLGDLAAGTLVIYSEREHKREQLPQAEPAPPPVSLSVDEQRAILDFAERSAYLSEQRQEELASYVPELTKQSAKPVQTLFQYANWLHGSAESKNGRKNGSK